MDTSLAVAILALVLSAFAVVTDYRHKKRIEALERDREARGRQERARAQLVAGFVELPGRSRATRKLRIENLGPSGAREVTVTLDGLPLPQHPIMFHDLKEAREIGPTGHVEYLVAFSNDSPRGPFKVDITWSDDSGEPGRYVTELTR